MITIYHNPRCSKSRQALSLLQNNGIQANIVLYLETPPTAETMKDLLNKLNMTARELIRKGEAEYKNNHLNDPNLSEDDLIDAMVKTPKLIERPIVVKGKKALLGRPPETVLQLI